jgi:HAD superfamily hydrolase (TIGR01509 family)
VRRGREQRLDEAALRVPEALQIGLSSHDSMSSVTTRRIAAILDVDGTLVDSNYHHALAWYRAFHEHDIVVPLCRLHRHVGMGGEKYVAAVAGDAVERELGDELRSRWEQLFDQLLPEIEPLDGAYELMAQLKNLGHPIVLASSAIESHFDAFIDDKLKAREIADAWTNKDDVEASKPDPDLVRAALSKAPTADAIMIGDTPWDCEAARRAGIATICVLTGGYSESELREAGAAAVFDSPRTLLERLGETPFATPAVSH